jgi:hypothetical protein
VSEGFRSAPWNLPNTVAQPGVLESLSRGVVRGLRTDPLVEPILSRTTEFFGFGPEELDEYTRRLSQTRLDDIGAFVGSVAPSIIGGVGAFTGGRVAARALANRTNAASRAFLNAGPQSVAQAGAAGATQVPNAPGALRAFEIAGGALGEGGFFAAQTAAAGEEPIEVAKAFALGAVLSGGIEGTLTALPRVSRALGVPVLKRGRPVGDQDPTAVARGAGVIQDERETLAVSLKNHTDRIDEILGVRHQEQELLNQYSDIRRSIRPRQPGAADDVARAGRQVQHRPDSKAGIAAAEAKAKAEKARRFRELRAARESLGEGELEDLADVRKVQLQTRAQLRALDQLESQRPWFAYTSETPLNPSKVGHLFATANMYLFRTSESLAGELGVTGNKIMSSGTDFFTEFKIAQDGIQKKLTEAMQETADAVFGSGKSLRKLRKIKDEQWLDVFDAWEQGDNALRAYMTSIGRGDQAERALRALNPLDAIRQKSMAGIEQLGGSRMLRKREIEATGRARLLPRIFRDEPVDKLEKDLIAAGVSRPQDLIKSIKQDGIRALYNRDLDRTLSGTYKELIAGGLPLEKNPWIAMFRAMNNDTYTLMHGQRYGLGEEAKKFYDTTVKAIVAEGGSEDIARLALDPLFNHKYYDQAMRAVADIMVSTQIGVKLPLAVVPNAFQTINTTTFFGYKGVAKAAIQAIRREGDSERIAQSVALSHSMVRGVGRLALEDRLRFIDTGSRFLDKFASRADRFSSNVLDYSLFSASERFNRVMAGRTSDIVVFDTIAKARAGRLKGHNWARANRMMSEIGIDLPHLLRTIEREGDEFLASPAFETILQNSMFRGAQITQFTPSALRRPLFWSHPIGRVAFQFKNFALGQYRFLRDHVVAEAALGNARPMANVLALYPIAGEAVKDIRGLLDDKDRPTDGVDRFAQNMLAVGGFGLATDIITQAQFGNLEQVVLGPTVGDMTTMVENLVRGDGAGIFKQVERQPIVKAISAVANGGAYSIEALDTYLADSGLSGNGESSAISLDDLRAQSVLDK